MFFSTWIVRKHAPPVADIRGLFLFAVSRPFLFAGNGPIKHAVRSEKQLRHIRDFRRNAGGLFWSAVDTLRIIGDLYLPNGNWGIHGHLGIQRGEWHWTESIA